VLKEFELADKVIVCSDYTLNSFLENNFPKDKLYNVALDANFTIKRSYDRNFYKDELIVGIAGGNILRKGFIYLLEAWAEMNLPNAKLLLKTSKLDLLKIPKIWSLIDGNDSIEIIGYLDDMEDFYERCDLFVLPSIDEGFGMVVFEALACSIPLIITKNVGAGDFITDGKEGYIVDIRNSQQIKDKIVYLNANRDVMTKMSINARTAFDNYQNRVDNYQNRVESLYKSYEKQI
jgi:glycosyltransferase involved in cell wall biosynthesis